MIKRSIVCVIAVGIVTINVRSHIRVTIADMDLLVGLMA